MPSKGRESALIGPASMDGGDVDGGVGVSGGFEKDEEAEERAELLRDRFRLSVISIANAEGSYPRSPFLSSSVSFELFDTLDPNLLWTVKKLEMEALEPVVACVADLAFKHTGERPNPNPNLRLFFYFHWLHCQYFFFLWSYQM